MAFLNKEDVSKVWGEKFAKLTEDENILFTEKEVHIKLSEEIVSGDGTVKLLKVRKAVAGDLLATDKDPGEVGKAFLLLGVLAEVPQASLKKMPIADFLRAQSVVTAFL